MKIYNEKKTELLENPDLEKGYLIPDQIVSKTIPAVEAVEEVSHYEYKEYPSGGRERFKVVDTPGVEAQPERYEYEEIRVYVLFTEEQLLQNELNKLDEQWFKVDYTKYEQMLRRRKELGIEDIIEDKVRNKTYKNLIELYTEAEEVARRISEIKNILKID